MLFIDKIDNQMLCNKYTLHMNCGLQSKFNEMQFLRLWLDHGICLSYKLKKPWTEYPLFFFSWKSTLAWFDDGISGKKDKNFNGQIGESI